MAMSLFRYGFGDTIVGHQAEVMLGPEPRRDPPNATEASHSSCGLNGGPSITTGQNQIKILHWNANGTVSRKWALAHFLKERKLDKFRIQETHLKKELRVSPRRYQAFRHDREETGKGGILLSSRKDVSAAETKFLEVEGILPSFKLQIYNALSPPTDAEISLDLISTDSKNLIKAGDL